MHRPKVFGIGLSKTGTTSLNQALEILGYAAKHHPTRWKDFEMYDAATDSPVADIFEKLDAEFPGSKFIYTVRDRESWLKSWNKFWISMKERSLPSPEILEIYQRLYGSLKYNRDLLIEAYQHHEQRVLTYFADRPEDLLTLNLAADDAGWEPLCRFLGDPIPTVAFPHGNDSAAVNAVASRLLHAVGDPREVARITRLSHQYLENLGENANVMNEIAKDPSTFAENTKIAVILARSCKYLGGVDAVAEIVGLPRSLIENVLASRRRRLRAKRLKKLKLEIIWLGTKITRPFQTANPKGP